MLDAVRHAQVQLSLALLVLIVCLGAMAWRNLFGRPLAPDVVVPAWLKGRSLPERLRARAAKGTDLGLAAIAVVLALLAMTAPRLDGTGLDRAQLLHETLQAKYHAELGWDGLYACAWAADRDAARKIRGYDEVRKLDQPSAEEDRIITKREEEVLQLIADGLSTPEVAEQLFISQKTVKNHLASIYQKLDARDRTQAVLQAVRMGIVHLD